MRKHRICFIGGGNMARSLIGGLIADGLDPSSVSVADPDADQRAALEAAFAITAHASNRDAVRAAETIVLAVKPQVLRGVALELAPILADREVLVLSIAAGVRASDLARWIGEDCAIVRAMPNTPALLGCGISGLVANASTSPAQRETAESILRAVGAVIWFDDEAAIDAVTAVSGSGPAYFFLFMECIAAAGRRLGLDAATARLLTVETAIGAGRMALESAEDLATLRRRVTSPGGTTEAALEVLGNGTLRDLVDDAIGNAQRRSVELAAQFGRD